MINHSWGYLEVLLGPQQAQGWQRHRERSVDVRRESVSDVGSPVGAWDRRSLQSSPWQLDVLSVLLEVTLQTCHLTDSAPVKALVKWPSCSSKSSAVVVPRCWCARRTPSTALCIPSATQKKTQRVHQGEQGCGQHLQQVLRRLLVRSFLPGHQLQLSTLTQHSLRHEVLPQPRDAASLTTAAAEVWFAGMVKLCSEHQHFTAGGEQPQTVWTWFHTLSCATHSDKFPLSIPCMPARLPLVWP